MLPFFSSFACDGPTLSVDFALFSSEVNVLTKIKRSPVFFFFLSLFLIPFSRSRSVFRSFPGSLGLAGRWSFREGSRSSRAGMSERERSEGSLSRRADGLEASDRSQRSFFPGLFSAFFFSSPTRAPASFASCKSREKGRKRARKIPTVRRKTEFLFNLSKEESVPRSSSLSVFSCRYKYVWCLCMCLSPSPASLLVCLVVLDIVSQTHVSVRTERYR